MNKRSWDFNKDYDLWIRISPEEVHFLMYIVESFDNLANVRHIDPRTGLLKIIVPGGNLEDMLKIVESLKTDTKLELVRIEEDPTERSSTS